MPDIVEVHGHVAEVADLPAAAFEGRLFWVDGTDPGLYRDNGTSWDYVAPSGGGGMSNPMTDYADIVIGGSGGTPDRLSVAGVAGMTLGAVHQTGGDPFRLDYIVPGITPPLDAPGFFTYSNINGSGSQAIVNQDYRGISRNADGTNWVRGFSRALPGNNKTVTVCVLPNLNKTPGEGAGLFINAGPYYGIGVFWDATAGWQIQTVYNDTSAIGDHTVVTTRDVDWQPFWWFRHFTTDTAEFLFQFSRDGRVWYTLETVVITGQVATPTTSAVLYRQLAATTDRLGVGVVSWSEV